VKVQKRYAIRVAMLAAGLSLAGCGSLQSSAFQNAHVGHEVSNGQQVPVGTNGVTGSGTVTRFDTPGHFPAIVQICNGTEGLYVSESSTGIVTVVPDDPGCGFKGASSGASSTVGPNKSDSINGK